MNHSGEPPRKGLATQGLEAYRGRASRRDRVSLELEAMRRELQSCTQAINEGKKRLLALHTVSTAVNRSLILEEIASAAADKIMEVMEVDAILLFVLEEGTAELKLKVYQGISEEFARTMDGLRLGEGFTGWVAQTGEPLLVEDSQLDPSLPREMVMQEGLRSLFIVPLKAGDKVVGVLCVAERHLRQFTPGEKELLELVGITLGVAIEKAGLYQESQRAMKRFQELFEKAHDAIWVQDLEGKATDANPAMALLTGYDRSEFVGKDVASFLTPRALDVARELRQKLLCGEEVRQPYEQRAVRKDGAEAIFMLTTSVLGDKEGPAGFQHIARDVTYERELQDELYLYIQQITKAHEEERSRIARELHDDTIQAIVALSHRLDSFISRGNSMPKEGLEFLADMQRDIDNILAGIRRFAQDLRPPTLEYLGLIPALKDLASQLRKKFACDARLKVKGVEQRFNPQEELLIYRIVQEALMNVWKHSEATRARIGIEFDDGKTCVTISDNGKGFEQMKDYELLKTGKLGVVGMIERARLLRATLTIRSKLGSGTTVSLDIPCNNSISSPGPLSSSRETHPLINQG